MISIGQAPSRGLPSKPRISSDARHGQLSVPPAAVRFGGTAATAITRTGFGSGAKSQLYFADGDADAAFGTIVGLWRSYALSFGLSLSS